jgi:hypothetical protein
LLGFQHWFWSFAGLQKITGAKLEIAAGKNKRELIFCLKRQSGGVYSAGDSKSPAE